MFRQLEAIKPLRKQAQLVMMRQCIIPALNHVMRNVDPDGCMTEYRQAKRVIATKIGRLADSLVPVRLGARDLRRGYMPIRNAGRVKDTDLVGLLVRYGGLGIVWGIN